MEETELRSRSDVWEQRIAEAAANEIQAIREEFNIDSSTASANTRSLEQAIAGFILRTFESGLRSGLIERS